MDGRAAIPGGTLLLDIKAIKSFSSQTRDFLPPEKT
jgi:hypothetical protein